MITVRYFCNERNLFDEHYESADDPVLNDTRESWMKWNDSTAGSADVHVHRFEEIVDQPDPDPARSDGGA